MERHPGRTGTAMSQAITSNDTKTSKPAAGSLAGDTDTGAVSSYLAAMAVVVGLIIAWVSLCAA